jgi:hypothetical protein
MSRWGWTATALIFSGRKDPVWPLSSAIVDRFISSWEFAVPVKKPLVSGSELGYRGCIIRDDRGREWYISHGVASHRSLQGTELRSDKDRVMETLILRSAPIGLLPESLQF